MMRYLVCMLVLAASFSCASPSLALDVAGQLLQTLEFQLHD